MTPILDILVVTDPHFVGQAEHQCAIAARRCEFGAIFLRKAMLRLKHLGIQPGLVVLLGDAVDQGNAPKASEDLQALAEALKAFKVPFLAVRGNHDGPVAEFERIFASKPGLHVINGVGILLFNDEVGEGDVTSRPDSALALVSETARLHPDMPLVALQHNPIQPRIDAAYPYMLTNTDAVTESYRQARVVLSLSGHYHAGQGPNVRDGVTYYTAPALCEAPFRFAHVRIEGRTVQVQEHALRLDVADLSDVHCHTEYAYCATTVSAARCSAVAEVLGLGQLCLSEHAFHLYFEGREAWSYAWQSDPARVEQVWRERSGRMDAYRRFIPPFRGPKVRLGLEVDLLADGRLLLAPEDRDGWDLLVGAVHAIPGYTQGVTTKAETERLFLRDTERLLTHGVAVLAHPFRFFAREKLETPRHLYPEVAQMLARYGVAAEINFHTNLPDPDFFRECLRRDVRIALGSDSHDITETGEFVPHLRVLEAAGVKRADFDRVLFRVP